MKKLNRILFFICLLLWQSCSNGGNEQLAGVNNTIRMSDFYDFQLKALDGEEIDFSRYKGKKVLLVNVASECGYTRQYEGLQKLHSEYGNKVAVLGFPANNFGGQEPGSNQQISDFCQKNYGVDFQMFSKISVKGADQHPLYEWLREQSGQEPSWNFCKYLLDEEGNVIGFYPSGVKPLDAEIVEKVR